MAGGLGCRKVDLVEQTVEELMVPRVYGLGPGLRRLARSRGETHRYRVADARQSRPTLITPCTDSLWHPRHRAQSDRPDLVVIPPVDCEELGDCRSPSYESIGQNLPVETSQ